MAVVEEREVEADGDCLRLQCLQLGDDAGDLRLFQGGYHLAEGIAPFGHLDDMRARHEGCGLLLTQRIEPRPLLAADLQYVAEALGHQQGGPCAFAHQKGVGGDGEAVDEEVDVAGSEPRLAGDARNACRDGIRAAAAP